MNTIEDHTLEDHKLWKQMTDVWDSLSTHFEPVVDRFMRTKNLDQGMLSLFMAALKSEPEPVMIADLMVRNPYTAAEKFQSRLSAAVGKGYLIEVEPGSFRLSSSGRGELLEMIRAAREAMAQADPLPLEDSRRLAGLFDRLVHACLETPPPPEPWSVLSSYRLMPDMQVPLPFIEQAFTCLWAYRDDCHLASWVHAGLTATAFEMLSLLWRNEASSVDEVYEKLAYRGHSRQIYGLALEELRERNFITGLEGGLSVTEEGRLFRNEVEEETERFFFLPWRSLSGQDKTIMAGLLVRLKEGLLRKVR